MIPQIMLSTSPFIGAGQFGARSMEYKRTFYGQPENRTKSSLTLGFS
ncbi:MAG: hypothetical protein K8R25_05200 [Methanosarcinales archaeon]|nr:hypothetical protein [Methanosarcinales archaeon]